MRYDPGGHTVLSALGWCAGLRSLELSLRRTMNLRQLEVLRAVMRCRTTIGAARELGMSQPAVSHAIKRTESQLGFRLFDRIHNRLVPTEEAKILPLFAIHQAINRKANDLRDGRAGRIR